jgi:drug/metabolite transporter (DMT)-like permease
MTSIDSARTPPHHGSREALGMGLGLVGVIIFGGTLPATKLALTGFSPWFVTFGRAVLAGAAAAFVLALLRRPLPRGHLFALAASSLMLVFGFPGLMAIAMQTVPASHGGVVLGILPLATAAFAALFAGERPSRVFWLWSVAGAVLVVAFAVRDSGLRLSPGDAWLFASGACAALGYVLFGKLSRAMPGWEVISWAMVLALPISLAGALATWQPDFAAAPPRAVAAFLYAAFFSMFLGFFAWNAGLAMGGIARVSQVQLLQTFVTLGLAALLLEETVDADTLAFALAVAAIVWMGRRSKIG